MLRDWLRATYQSALDALAFGAGAVKIEVFFVCSVLERTNMMQLPQEIVGHIAGFIADDVRACDPRCYRASRCVQAAWRGWATRLQKWRCKLCGRGALLGIKLTADSGRVYARVAFGRLGFGIVHHRRRGRRVRRIPLACSDCHTSRLGSHLSAILQHYHVTI